MFVFGIFFMMLFLIFFFGFYIFAAYVFSRVGEKFRTGSFLSYLIPVYNVMLLCDCAGITRWVTLAVVAPGIVVLLMSVISMMTSVVIFSSAAKLVCFCANVYLWGSIAERLKKDFWLWGIATPLLLGLPVLVLAFDSSMPESKDGDEEPRTSKEGETRYIDV